MSGLLDKRVWTIGDFVEWSGMTRCQAKAFLKRLDRESGGSLLTPSEGKNRKFTFYPASLSRLHPELFARLEGIEARVEELESRVLANECAQKQIATQVGQNSRAIRQLSLKFAA